LSTMLIIKLRCSICGFSPNWGVRGVIEL